MFERRAIQALIDETSSLPHTVFVLSPYAAELRPDGFGSTVPHYRVLVERAAFRMRAVVLPDYLAVSIVAAVVSGATNTPSRVKRLVAEIEERGWTAEVSLTQQGFRLEAISDDVPNGEDAEPVTEAVRIGLLLSEFVIDQLIVTRPLGEMRPAVDRPNVESGSGQVWLYDPTERDRATQVHRSLENWLIAKLREHGLEPLDPAGEPFFDLAWRVRDGVFVCEVKSSSNAESQQLRLGLGQVLQYRHLLSLAGPLPVRAALLIEGRPADLRWLDVCTTQDVTLFWPSRWEEVAELLTSMEGPR